MYSTEIGIDKNLVMALGITMILVILCVIYFKLLSVMIKGKHWKVAMGIFIGLFIVTLTCMVLDLQSNTQTNMSSFLILLSVKLFTIMQGIFYLSVELGHSQGLRKTTVSLLEHEVFLVLTTISVTNILVNLHTLAWNFERGLIAIIFNVLFAYLVVNIVFYLGEIKYYFIYAAPMIIVFLGLSILNGGYADDKVTAFLQTQVGLILTLILTTVYLGIKMRYDIVESRNTIRKVDAVNMEQLGLR